MPYKFYTTIRQGKKKWAAKNTKTGKVTLYTSPEKRANGIRVREAFAHNTQPRGLANASKSTRKKVARMGGKARRRY